MILGKYNQYNETKIRIFLRVFSKVEILSFANFVQGDKKLYSKEINCIFIVQTFKRLK